MKKIVLICVALFVIAVMSIWNVNGEGYVSQQGNMVTIDLGKVATTYEVAFKGVNLSFNLSEGYTLIDEEKTDTYIELHIQGPEVKAVGRDRIPIGIYSYDEKPNVIEYYRDSFSIKIQADSYPHKIFPVDRALTIHELASPYIAGCHSCVLGICGYHPDPEFITISGHDAVYEMIWPYFCANILTGGGTYVSIRYYGSPFAISSGYGPDWAVVPNNSLGITPHIDKGNGVKFSPYKTDRERYGQPTVTIDGQPVEDRYRSDTKAIMESININGWAFDKTIMVMSEPLKYFDVTIKPENEAMLNKLKKCGGKVLWTGDEIVNGQKKFKLRLFQMDVYDGNGKNISKSFEVTRESTRCSWGLSDTADDLYGTNAIAPPGIYYGRLDEKRNYKRVILSGKKGERNLMSAKGTTRGGIQIHGVYHIMRNGTWGCLGVPGNDYNRFIDLFEKEDTIWVELLPASLHKKPSEYQKRSKISIESIELNKEGNDLYKSGNYENAIKAYDNAIEIDAMNYVAWHSRGSAFYQLGKYNEAVESYNRSLEIDPYNMEVWYGKGISLYELGRYNEAVEAFDKVLEIDPENKKALESKKNVLELIKNPADYITIKKQNKIIVHVPKEINASEKTEIKVTNPQGNPMSDIMLTITLPDESVVTKTTDENGIIEIFSEESGKLIVNAEGYDIEVKSEVMSEQIYSYWVYLGLLGLMIIGILILFGLYKK